MAEQATLVDVPKIEPLKLWSWTTLAKMGLGTSDALVNWAAKATAEVAIDSRQTILAMIEERGRDEAVKWLTRTRFETSKKAAARGTDVHRAAEELALGQKPEVEEHVMPYVEQYQRFLSEHEPRFVMAEAPVYHTSGPYYAGTCDGIMELQGRIVLFDIKTTPHGPNDGRTRPPYDEVALQLTAYRRAEYVGVISEQRYSGGRRYYLFDESSEHATMPETDGAVCIVVSPFDYLVIPVRTDEAMWEVVRHVIECARWRVETSKNVFGPPITAPRKEAVA